MECRHVSWFFCIVLLLLSNIPKKIINEMSIRNPHRFLSAGSNNDHFYEKSWELRKWFWNDRGRAGVVAISFKVRNNEEVGQSLILWVSGWNQVDSSPPARHTEGVGVPHGGLGPVPLHTTKTRKLKIENKSSQDSRMFHTSFSLYSSASSEQHTKHNHLSNRDLESICVLTTLQHFVLFSREFRKWS